jgi:hypothetical protein
MTAALSNFHFTPFPAAMANPETRMNVANQNKIIVSPSQLFPDLKSIAAKFVQDRTALRFPFCLTAYFDRGGAANRSLDHR